MILDPILDRFRGQAITIPPMDGAFRPDRRLDEAEVLASLPQPDVVASSYERLLVTSGRSVFSIAADGTSSAVATFPSAITAFAVSPFDEIAVGLEDGKLMMGRAEYELAKPASRGGLSFLIGGKRTTPEAMIDLRRTKALNCITALAFDAKGGLWVANGSADQPASAWKRDLLQNGSSGSIWKAEAGETLLRAVAGGLAFPYGLLCDRDGVIVSESWRHRLLRVEADGARSVVLDDLPGYPARLSAAADGGAWLAIFAPRNRLVEFVLQEEHYREHMLAEVAPDHWIAPALSSHSTFLEPLQCGAIRTMGVHKPWSPSRSYGMVVRLDPDGRPVGSLHSRADGARHGTTSAVEHDGRLIVASKGGDCLLGLDLAAAGRA